MQDQSKVGTDWTVDELDLIVAEYFAMLALIPTAERGMKARRKRELDEKIHRGIGSIDFKLGNLSAVACELGTSLPRLAIAWCLKNPHVSTVILGASRLEQLQENLGALALVDQLTTGVLDRLEKISRPVAS